MGEEMMRTRAEVVNAARSWVGTAFHHQGRKKAANGARGGCDCLGLLVGVARELELQARDGQGALADFDEVQYGHLPDGVRLQAVLARLLYEVPQEQMQMGDVVLLRFDGRPQHLALVSEYEAGGFGVIHALAANRRVVEHRLDALWCERIVQVYRLPDLQ